MANDNAPETKNVEKHQIEIKVRRSKAEAVPVNIEFTKRRKLDRVLDLLDGFTPKEIWQIVRVYMRRRKSEQLQTRNSADIKHILKG